MRRALQYALIASAVAVTAPALADDRPLLAIEATVSRGLAVGGGGGDSTTRVSPTSVGASFDYAIRSEPWTTVTGGVFYEGGGRGGFGLRAGLRAAAGNTPIRLGASAVAIVSPYTLGGIAASGGRCWSLGGALGLCGDVEGTVFAIGGDLPDGRVAAQLLVVLGVRVDVQ